MKKPMNPETVRALATNVQKILALYDQQRQTHVKLMQLCVKHIEDRRPTSWLTKEEYTERVQLLDALRTYITESTKEETHDTQRQPDEASSCPEELSGA